MATLIRPPLSAFRRYERIMTFWQCCLPLLVLGWLLSPGPAWACNVPVFRYALERWRSTQDEDRYQFVVFHRGSLAQDEAKVVSTLRTAGERRDAPANLSVETVDLSNKAEGELQQLWEQQGAVKLPWMVLRYPVGRDERRTVWSGLLRVGETDSLLDSPARREIARRLMRGDSVVWILLESGDKERDDAADTGLRTQLPRLEKSVQLPDAADEDSVKLLSNLPLRLAFSSLRVRRTDAAEKMLVEMLLHADSDLANSVGPMVFPIFGRGRVMDALIGEGINAETLRDTARFLCGACSCQVKRLNPGVDLLIAADWDSILEDREEVTPRSAFPKRQRVPIPTPNQRTEPGSGETTASPSGARLPIAVALGMVLVVTLGLAWRARRRKGEPA